MTITEIQQLLSATVLQMPEPDAVIHALMTDTRHLPLPGALFFSLTSQRNDGHAYIQEAFQAGVRHFIVSKHTDLSGCTGANVLLVADTLAALQHIAAAHRSHFKFPVVGITGSNGKTIVKEWLYQILAPAFHIIRSPKSYNSQIGVPLSVWEIKDTHQLGIFEAGISQPGEMARLQPTIQPDIGIFTNIGSAHSDGFISEAQKAAEKMKLFDRSTQLVCRVDQPVVREAAEAWKTALPSAMLWSWSLEGNAAEIQVKAIPGDQDHTIIHLDYYGEIFKTVIPFADAASVENAVHAWVAGIALGVDMHLLAEGLQRLAPIEMRLELKSGIEDSTLINDFYNNDLSSLQILLQVARHPAKGKKVTLILSDILQSGMDKNTLYKQVADTLKGVDRLIGIGQDIPAISAFLPDTVESHFYPDTPSFLGDIGRHKWRNNLVMLKGARQFEFEHIARRLEKKAHQTRLEINLNALVHNLKVYTSLLQPGVKTMAMVKAAAYGSGGAEVARLLEFYKVNYLGVAYADEGIELRQAGVQLPILVLNPDTAGFDVFFRYHLEPEIYSMETLEELIRYTGDSKKMTIHLKLDTGMHRLGFEPRDMEELCGTLRDYPNIRVASVFSHLSASDNPVFDLFTHQQAAAFTQMYTIIRDALGYQPIRHIVNTGGVARFPEYHFDMVRLGIGLYGIDSSGLQNRLQVVNILKTTVSQVKHIPAGDSVGYNRNSGLLQAPVKIATISIGYADGFLRAAGGGAYKVLINNTLVPTIGNVCMDMTMIDVTHVPGVKAGDEVVVFGHQPKVEELAKCLKTIPYEIFTNISDRVKRVYVQE